ncbi:MAG: DsbC family protein [Gammaproteobacteria bacterium]|nr:DsbC family protein [Gammaproteobacteria bacterium]
MATLRADWRAAHQIVDSIPQADIDHIKGRVHIDRGDSLSLDIDVSLSMPSTAPKLEDLVFSLNPGLQLHQVLVDGESAEYRHESGLLVVEPRRPPHPAGEFVLSVVAEGIPDPRFAYLDSSVEPSAKSWSESRLPFLGTRASVFDDAFVALMPGTRWLPAPGPNLAGSTVGPRDFFTVDLEIEVPSGWRIAAPGVGRPTDFPNRVRFALREALLEVTVVTAPFERFAVQVGNAEFELLLHSAHLRNVEWPDDMEQAMVQLLTEFVEDAEDFGIRFPYGGLSVVEVPAQLRIYGGGDRMHSVQNNAGVLLVREHGFPMARLDRWLSWEFPAVPRLYQFWGYFDRDRTGGNLLAGATDNLVRLVTAPVGDNADAAESLLANHVAAVHGPTLSFLCPRLRRQRSFGDGAGRPPNARNPTGGDRHGNCRQDRRGSRMGCGSSFALVPRRLTEARREARRRQALAQPDATDMIVFAPAEAVAAVLYAFTDVDCHYCRQLHDDMARLNDLGIEVRYLAYPRAGPGTPTYDMMVAVWCAENPQAAMTAAKRGETVVSPTCADPVAEQFELGRSLHIGGTPTMVTEGGEQLYGYHPPDELARRLGVL